MNELSNMLGRWRGDNRSTHVNSMPCQAVTQNQKANENMPTSVSQSVVIMQMTSRFLLANCLVRAFGCVLALSLVFSLGCSGGQGILGVDELADFPAGALPEKSGAKACRWHQAQAGNAAIDRKVFYRSDFVGNTDQIAPAAAKSFTERIQLAGPAAPVLVVLEPSENTQLDQVRLAALSNLAGRLGVENAQFQVGFPPALGLLGSNAERIGRSAVGTGNRGGGGTTGQGNRGGFGIGNTTNTRGF